LPSSSFTRRDASTGVSTFLSTRRGSAPAAPVSVRSSPLALTRRARPLRPRTRCVADWTRIVTTRSGVWLSLCAIAGGKWRPEREAPGCLDPSLLRRRAPRRASRVRFARLRAKFDERKARRDACRAASITQTWAPFEPLGRGDRVPDSGATLCGCSTDGPETLTHRHGGVATRAMLET
jgi:hypothetical protein